MIIAIPAVTKYISGSKDTTYITTVNKLIDTAMGEVTGLEYSVSNENFTYYIPTKCLTTENDRNESPYGEFVQSYVVVTYNEGKNDYYFTGVDDSGHGILLTYRDHLDESTIKTDLKSIDTSIGIGNRQYNYVYSVNCDKTREKISAHNNIDERGKKTDVTTEDQPSGDNPSGGGSSSGVSGGTTPVNIVCIPATTLHTKKCNRNDQYGCNAQGSIGYNKTITYGTIPNGTPKPGDAFDCKVTADGDYTERFYYVTSEGDNSILIYYKNINEQTNYQYDSENVSWHGPRTAYQYLPSTSEWNNTDLIYPSLPRQLVADNGETSGYGITLDKFTYEGKAARFLTLNEVKAACGNSLLPTTDGYLNNCTWLMENIGLFEQTSGTYGYWLETVHISESATQASRVVGSSLRIFPETTPNGKNGGVRPVITVKTEGISS